MDFKGYFKNKFIIIALILGALILICVPLVQFSNVFFIIICILGSALCAVIATKNVFDVKKINNTHTEELLPLNSAQAIEINKFKKAQKTNAIIKAILFYTFALIFFAILFK